MFAHTCVSIYVSVYIHIDIYVYDQINVQVHWPGFWWEHVHADSVGKALEQATAKSLLRKILR